MERVTMSVFRGASIAVLALGLAAGGCASRGRSDGPTAAQQIGVNGYLWRASLDTLAFMPLASADPYGGVIITDWYANPEKPDERFKAQVYILDTRLRRPERDRLQADPHGGRRLDRRPGGRRDRHRDRERHPHPRPPAPPVEPQRPGLIAAYASRA
jgi:hypothetical protein